MASEFVSSDTKPQGSVSLAAVLSAFVPTWTTGLIFVAIFVAIRHRYPHAYSPRTYMGTIPERHRTPKGDGRLFDWVSTMYHVPDKFLLYHQCLDSYLYLRFLRTIILICVVGSFLTWPILMPLNATGGGTSTELDRIAIGNVARKSYLWGHAVVGIVFFAFVMFTIARERIWLIGMRQAWLLSKPSASRISSRTVLYLSAPQDAQKEENMERYFGAAAEQIWAVSKTGELGKLVAERKSAVEELEAVEIAHIISASQHRRQQQGQSRQSVSDSARHSIREKIRKHRERVQHKEQRIEKLRREHEESEEDHSTAVFVEFKTRADAQRACQQVVSADVLAFTPRFLGVAPKEVLWPNLTIPAARRISQEGVALGVVTALIVFWSIPSGIIGLISNIKYLAKHFAWLHWLNRLPDSVIGLLSGLVPPLLTSALNKYVANMFRYIFKQSGVPTTIANELKVQKWFYIFQVTQVFLVTAVFSGGATVAAELLEKARDPSSIPAMLAEQLPKSSNYYITYFIVQGSTTASDNLLNYSDLLWYYVAGWLFDKTPRQKFSRFTGTKGISWGKVFPKFSNFAIIAIAYSCIAPIVTGFAAIGLALYYYSYRHNLLFVIQPKLDTHGQAYALALQHLMTGVYIAELALVGFFGLNGVKGQATMMGVFFVLTVAWHAILDRYLTPLEQYIPTNLENRGQDGEVDETAPLLASAEEGNAQSHIQRIGATVHAPSPVVDRLARFFEPHVFASFQAMQAWLREDGDDFEAFEQDAAEYSKEDLRKAYVNPDLTSGTPVVWLAKDQQGVSAEEVRESEEASLKATDQGAWIDDKGRLRWSEDNFSEVPIWKESVQY